MVHNPQESITPQHRLHYRHQSLKQVLPNLRKEPKGQDTKPDSREIHAKDSLSEERKSNMNYFRIRTKRTGSTSSAFAEFPC